MIIFVVICKISLNRNTRSKFQKSGLSHVQEVKSIQYPKELIRGIVNDFLLLQKQGFLKSYEMI